MRRTKISERHPPEILRKQKTGEKNKKRKGKKKIRKVGISSKADKWVKTVDLLMIGVVKPF